MNKVGILKSTYLGKYFTAYEFCNKKDGYAIECKNQHILFPKLDMVREVVGSTTITSGYRTKKFNAIVKGSPNSNHLIGHAVDITFDFSDWSVNTLIKLLTGIGFKNVGIYLNRNSSIAWCHVDIGDENLRRWNEGNGWFHYRDSAVKIYKNVNKEM